MARLQHWRYESAGPQPLLCVHFDYVIVRSAPMVINPTPATSRQLNGSPSTVIASSRVSGRLSLSMGATREAGPN